jgi:type III secretory pathway component EscT
VIPLVEVVGNADKLAPQKIGATAVNIGVILGLTVTVIEAVAAQPAAFVPVTVYVVVTVGAIVILGVVIGV